MAQLPGTTAEPEYEAEAPRERIALAPPRKAPLPVVKAIDDAAPPITPKEDFALPETVVTAASEPLRQPAIQARESTWRPGLTPRALPDLDRDEEQAPGWGETFDAAYRQYNDVVNAIEWARRPQFKENPEYNLFEDERFKGTAFERDYTDNFIESRSREETGAIIGRIENEWKRRETLSRAGLPGMVATFSAGAMSPLIFVPLLGWYRTAVAGGRAANIAVRAGEGAAAGAATAAVYEGTLQGIQETRTSLESMFAVGTAALLGGVLGEPIGGIQR